MERRSLVRPAELDFCSVGGQDADDLAVDVVDGGGEEEQGADDPAEVADPGPRLPRRRLRLPCRTSGELELVERRGLHLDAVARDAWARRSGRSRSAPGSTKCSCRWSTYSQTRPSRRGVDRDVVEDREVLDVFAEADAARVGADRHAELRGHEQDRQHLVDPAHAAGVDLADADGVRLQELLEDDPVLAGLAGGHPDRAPPPARWRRGRARRPGSWAPRSSRGRTGPAPSSAGSPPARPSTGSRPWPACGRGRSPRA